MNSSKLASLVLASFLHFAPIAARTVQSLPALASSPVAIVLKWVVGALALAGSYHAVSAGSAVLQSPSTIQGTVGTRLSYQIKINDGERRQPESWVVGGQAFNAAGSTTAGMPPGLALSLTTGIISGAPTQGGTFPVDITAFENRNLGGHSLEFVLTFVIAGGAAPPTITTQPLSGTAVEGTTFGFSVTATGTGTLNYQWQHAGQNIQGATGSTLTLSPVELTDAGDYGVTVSNAGGSTTSSTATLVVTPATAPPVIETQPVGGTFEEGASLTLRVVTSGTRPLSYQWRRNGSDLTGQTSSSLTIAAVSAQDSGDYTVVVSGPGGSSTSASATITVLPLSAQLLAIDSGGARLLFHTVPGRTYVVESSDSAVAGTWQVVANVTATDTVSGFTDSQVAKPMRFWRYRPAP